MEINNKWYGSDACQITSLFEYSLLGRRVQCNKLEIVIETPIYSDAPMWRKRYQVVEWSKKESRQIMAESWFRQKEFLSFCGLKKAEFMKMNALVQLQDLCQYYGTDNILGSSYGTMRIRQVIRKITTKQN
jgi:hypothetical protein